MMYSGLVRLGQDAELKQTTSGMDILNLSVAYNYGKKDAEGKRPTQWMRLTMFGTRAVSLAPYLTKGSLIHVVARDLHIREWQTDTKSGASLEGTVVDIEFAGGGSDRQASSPAQAAHQQGKANGYQPQSTPALDNWDDDVPF